MNIMHYVVNVIMLIITSVLPAVARQNTDFFSDRITNNGGGGGLKLH